MIDDCEIDEEIPADEEKNKADACVDHQQHATAKDLGVISTGPTTHQDVQDTDTGELHLM